MAILPSNNDLIEALRIGREQGGQQVAAETSAELEKAGAELINELSIASGKPRDTGNPLNDLTGIGGGKPLQKPTPPPKEMQLPIPGIDWRKFLVNLMINPEQHIAAKDKDGNEVIPDGYDAITGMEWIYNKDGESEFIYPDDIIDLDKAGLIKQLMIAKGFNHPISGTKSTGLGSMSPEDVGRLKAGNPGASDKIDKEVKQIRQGINLPTF